MVASWPSGLKVASARWPVASRRTGLPADPREISRISTPPNAVGRVQHAVLQRSPDAPRGRGCGDAAARRVHLHPRRSSGAASLAPGAASLPLRLEHHREILPPLEADGRRLRRLPGRPAPRVGLPLDVPEGVDERRARFSSSDRLP